VMEGIPPAAGKDVDVVNWFSHHGEYWAYFNCSNI
jgi:hypothetical protein